MNEFVYHNGKKLRKGYTTGVCAAAAATAASSLLFHDEVHEQVKVELPDGKSLLIPVHSVEYRKSGASAFVKKDGGDDADATDGMLIGAEVKRSCEDSIIIDGGIGIGRVTQKGLPIEVGFPAVNPVPRKMIEASVRKVIGAGAGAEVTVFAPDGERVARQTMNSRLGIMGGISILGTTGIVTPMSEEGWKQAITVELEMKQKQGMDKIVLCPGNYGEDFAVKELRIPPEKIVSMSNFVGYVLKEVQRLGFTKILIVGHIGKLIKVAGGIFSTHSKDADARSEILVANLALLGVPLADLKQIAVCTTTEAAGELIAGKGYENVYPLLAGKIKSRSEQYLKYRKPEPEIEVVLFSSQRGLLAATKNTKALMEEWQ